MKIETSNVCRSGVDLNKKTNKKSLETDSVSMKTRSNGSLYIAIESQSLKDKDINERTQIVFNADEIRRIRMITTLWG